MKLTFRLLLGLSLCFTSASCQDTSSEALNQLRKSSFPSFEEVYTRVNKEITSPGKDCQFSLAKKSDGYYLVITKYVDNKFLEPQFMKAWDAATNKFQVLKIDQFLERGAASEDFEGGLESVRNSGKFYNFNYFFGYPDYTRDLIELLKDREDLNNRELEMLARAYSTEACDYIHPNQSGSQISKTKDLPDPFYEKITPGRVNSFKELADLSLSCYANIEKNDPEYKTLIFDDLNLKINHDIMHYYLLFKSVKEDKLAAEMLNRASYEADAVAYAKELLIDCAKDAVLVTSGDSDTYPLWYVQDVLGFRKDVRVINHSLLFAAWYFDFIKNTTSVRTSLTKEEYQFYSRAYILLEENPGPSPGYNEWLSDLKSGKQAKLTDPKRLLSWEDMPKAKTNLTLSITSIPTNLNTRGFYISGVDLCILDMINANPAIVFYTTTPYLFMESALNAHFAKRNLVYELTSPENSSYWDKNSFAFFEKAVKANRINYATAKMGITKYVINSRLFDWTSLTDEEAYANRELFSRFEKQLDIQKYTAINDFELLSSYTAALWKTDPGKAVRFLDRQSDQIVQYIQAIDNQKVCTEEDVNQLNAILRMFQYGDHTISTGPPNTDKSESYKQVITALRQKVKTLCNNPKNRDEMGWHYKSLTNLNSELEYM